MDADQARSYCLDILGSNPAYMTFTNSSAELEVGVSLLGMSRQQVRRLMDAGKLPFRMVGTHHRIRVADFRAFDEGERERQAKAMDESTAHENELGLFE